MIKNIGYSWNTDIFVIDWLIVYFWCCVVDIVILILCCFVLRILWVRRVMFFYLAPPIFIFWSLSYVPSVIPFLTFMPFALAFCILVLLFVRPFFALQMGSCHSYYSTNVLSFMLYFTRDKGLRPDFLFKIKRLILFWD